MSAVMEDKPKPAASDAHSAAQEIQWEDFRDHLTTAE